MAKQPTLSDLTSQYSTQSLINNNWAAIEEAFLNTLSRDGSSPNQMEADIDLNSNDLLNVKDGYFTGDLTVKGVNILESIGGGGDGGTTGVVSSVRNTFTGDGSTTNYTLTREPVGKGDLFVFIDGVCQFDTQFTLSGSTLSFLEAPYDGASIQIMLLSDLDIGTAEASNIGYVGVESTIQEAVDNRGPSFETLAELIAWATDSSTNITNGLIAWAAGVAYKAQSGATELSGLGLPGWRTIGGSLSADVTFNIPTDFPTIQAAIDEYASVTANGYKITLNIESGETEATGLLLRDGNFIHFTITSDDAEVPVDIQDNGLFTAGHGAHFFFENCQAPVISTLFNAQQTGGEFAGGFFITGPNSAIRFDNGCGMKNVGVPRLSGDPAEILADQFGFGLIAANGATVRANYGVFTGNAARNVWITRIASITAEFADLSGAKGDGTVSANDCNVYITRGSSAVLGFATINDGANRGLISSRSKVYLRGTEVRNNAGNDLQVELGGEILANGVRTTSSVDLGGGTYEPDADDTNVSEINARSQNGLITSASSPVFPISYTSGGFYVRKESDGQMTLKTTSAVTLVYELGNQIRTTLTFPEDFTDDEYHVDVGIRRKDSGEHAVSEQIFSRSVDGCIVALVNNDGFYTVDSEADVTVLITGRWK